MVNKKNEFQLLPIRLTYLYLIDLQLYHFQAAGIIPVWGEEAGRRGAVLPEDRGQEDNALIFRKSQ